MPTKRHIKRHAPRQKRIAHIPGHTDEFKTAEELGVSIRTLRKWRQLRIGPPWTSVGRFIHYSDESRAEWLKSREVKPITELKQRQQGDEAAA
jgi:hypothetical protein